jgi:hypothetical protein
VRTEGAAPLDGIRSLVPDLSIGAVNGAEELMFTSISHLRVGVDGKIWIFDSVLRLYDSTGKFLRQAGRRGIGPGEYERVMGLVILPNGNAVLWDGDRSVLRVYSSEGDPVTDLRVPVAHAPGLADFMQNTLLYDTTGYVYLRGRTGGGSRGLIRIALDGSATDTIAPPGFGLKSWSASAFRDGGGTSSTVDHLPEEMWTLSPLGYFVVARSDQYALHLLHPGGKVMRIERGGEPAPLADGEWDEQFESIIPSMRRYVPNWQWTGPVPTSKPHFLGIRVADDGRLWVQVTTASEVIPDAERPTMVRPGSSTPVPYGTRFRQALVYDVFAPSGEFLGRIPVPPRASLLAMRGNHIWARTLDADDVQTVIRFRIEPPLVAASNVR